ncbi:MAG: histidine kinase [Chloroflexi bacterium]|nr:histidine kinase [Chloroflexota bacterium]
MTYLSSQPRFGEAPISPTLDELIKFLQESIAPGIVRVMISESGEALPCVCTRQHPNNLYSGITHPLAFEIEPVPSCPLLSQGVWTILCERGATPQANGEILCAVASVAGLGSLAVQAEISHFARQDFRYRRFCCRALHLALLSAINLMEGQRALERVHERDEQVRHLVHSNALARKEERERLSRQLHDSVIQSMVSAFHMVEAIREMGTHEPEHAAVLQIAEGLLSQTIREIRGIINVLHTATPEPEIHDR